MFSGKSFHSVVVDGIYFHSSGKFAQGWVNTTHLSLGAVHSANGTETRRVHYIVNVTSSAESYI